MKKPGPAGRASFRIKMKMIFRILNNRAVVSHCIFEGGGIKRGRGGVMLTNNEFRLDPTRSKS